MSLYCLPHVRVSLEHMYGAYNLLISLWREVAPVSLDSSSFIKFVAFVPIVYDNSSSLCYHSFSLAAYTFQAQAISTVQDYKGQCVLEVSPSSISVKVAPCLEPTTEKRDLGTWPFDCIRRFNTQVREIREYC